MNSEQLVFNLGEKKMMGRDQLFRSQSNELALSIIENYPKWPKNRLVLVGPKGCGKTHISSIFSCWETILFSSFCFVVKIFM